ncbi:MAG TPA: peptide chain release factor 2 [Negativicutes bacterium]|uniref:Peptide chain release factor 2 n=1 Tax=Candidatus Staskawiczbacteria bacterium RIFCSPHIGHO2_01_FULL_41_41 TaxID=1802203 RepID=A0A1G2HTD6_9BACT|nr:MAG: peptide chain release factor 2 [Candidatus Staskawiczbacteria bacterium RIFCSPHIGHO2_01_FULL_41_41]OGZ68305.1 MAG: peptide chain release factor 2 [Candidatus Staskawiczbacteria bacterium RIFCSPHIGHO2_02_FULL_43_16]OGZ75096.1 MAG: peptide chain release factor 2 [Candidatus Staskawiczbacteria bacterium RIFCSPLOWO2_01_FULL_43_17b]HLD70564.1 peptide chain release factor 2 [Negativicutes bacterium]
MNRSNIWWTGFDVDVKEKELKALELQTQAVDFWNDHQVAATISQKIAELKEELEVAESLKKEFADLKELNELGQVDEAAVEKLQVKVAREESKAFLSGKYDKNNAILEIFSGAGGVDAQDWATMLLRMYQRYCVIKGWKAEILHQSFGEGGGPDGRIGTKNVTLAIQGKFAYGMLKKEAGVHRLVRQSPFSSQKLRHTSFALVEVMPEIAQSAELEIKPEDLRVDTFRASGPGGQYVNKTESAIRLTHIPTGIAVASQSERSQGRNRENAMKILYAKLHAAQQQEHKKELKEIKAAQNTGRASPAGGENSASWGNQIRSYVLHPYKMVKDLRTQYETSQAEDVLEGNLEEFIQAEVKYHD